MNSKERELLKIDNKISLLEFERDLMLQSLATSNTEIMQFVQSFISNRERIKVKK